MIRKLFATVLAFVSLALVAGVACADGLSAGQKLLELRKAETGAGGAHRSEAERQRDIESAYAGLFNSAAQDGVRTQLDIAQLKAMFEATHLVAFYTRKPKYIQAMADDLNELERLHAASPSQFIDYHRMLIATRRFVEARSFVDRHPGVGFEAIPPINDLVPREWHGPTMLTVTVGGLVRQPVTPHASFVVIVAHPLCHFSQNAVNAIAADPELSKALTQAIWLAPPDGNLRLDLFRNWNRTHPAQQMAFAYDKAEWPSIDSWETPTFYFFSRDELVGKVTGWPASGHAQELRDQLKKLE